ncbi:uncharacterized protein LOC144539406 [Centroberyx gerrardi]
MRGRSKTGSAKSRPKSAAPLSDEGQRRPRQKRRTSPKKRDGTIAIEHPTVSPLIYDPQRAVEELLQGQPLRTEDGEESVESLRSQLYEREHACSKPQAAEQRVFPSKRICRFELPMDFSLLETLSPQLYLQSFCRVCERRRKLYRRVFDKFDKDRDGLLSLELLTSVCPQQEMRAAVSELHGAEVDAGRLLLLMEVEEGSRFDWLLVCAACALSERLFHSHLTEDLREEEEDEEEDSLEKADLNSLLVKLNDYCVPAPLTRLLTTISISCYSRGRSSTAAAGPQPL